MSRTNRHKKVFLHLLSQYCPSIYYQLCPANARFPRTEFEFRQLPVDGVPYEKFLLTINCYDKAQCETMDEYLDELIREADKRVYITNAEYYQFYYNNDRQPVPEADKTIRRIMLTFEVRIYIRSDS